jgi:hypothetical protein
MPEIPRPDIASYYFECPKDVMDAFKERCRQTRRSIKAEMVLALQFWLQQPLEFLPPAEKQAARKK